VVVVVVFGVVLGVDSRGVGLVGWIYLGERGEGEGGEG
jgi:hypothetical protein